jgi:hypothetical protein
MSSFPYPPEQEQIDSILTSVTNLTTRTRLLEMAAKGDLVLTVSPATIAEAATNVAHSRVVNITLKNSAGEIHTWFNGLVTSVFTIADTSALGTASLIAGSGVNFVNGSANKNVSMNAQNWLAGEIVTVTVATLTIMGYSVVPSNTSVATYS